MQSIPVPKQIVLVPKYLFCAEDLNKQLYEIYNTI